MNQFITWGSGLLHKGATSFSNFFKPRTPIAKQSSVTQSATSVKSILNTSSVSLAQRFSLFSNISGKLKDARNSAVALWDRAYTGTRNYFKSNEIKKAIEPVRNAFTTGLNEIATTGIKKLFGNLQNKLYGGEGQSGTPVDIRPDIENTARPTTQNGFLDFWGGLSTPQGAFNLGYNQEPIPAIPSSDGETNVQVSSGGSNNLMTLAIIGGVLFFIFKGRK